MITPPHVPAMIAIDEKILGKNGPELFKELLRIYSVADIEDYYKDGQWREELIKADLQLISMHRLEAGAPEPPPGDITLPPLPAKPAPPVHWP